MIPKIEMMKNLLDRHLNINGQESVGIISLKGSVIVSDFKNVHESDQVERLIGDLAVSINSMTQKEGFGDIDQIFIENGEKKLFIHYSLRHGFFIVLMGTEALSEGLLRFEIDRVMHRLEEKSIE